jgi:hypothetical protein
MNLELRSLCCEEVYLAKVAKDSQNVGFYMCGNKYSANFLNSSSDVEVSGRPQSLCEC